MLSTRFGVAAIDAVHEKKWGSMVALQHDAIITVPLEEAVAELKHVTPELWETAKQFFA